MNVYSVNAAPVEEHNYCWEKLTLKYYKFTCLYFNILYMILVFCIELTIDIISMYVM